MGIGILNKLRRASPPEVLAQRATNDDLWGPSPRDLHELNALSFQPKACEQILKVLEYRLGQSGRHWRQKSKALTVLHYLLLSGSEQCYLWMRARRKEVIEPLLRFRYSDSKNVDQGLSVREKTATLVELIKDQSRLDQEREKYARQKETLRTSIGRPSSSRHTLDLVRSDMNLTIDTSISPSGTNGSIPPPESPTSPPPEKGRLSLALGLDAIQEESF